MAESCVEESMRKKIDISNQILERKSGKKFCINNITDCISITPITTISEIFMENQISSSHKILQRKPSSKICINNTTGTTAANSESTDFVDNRR